jgi:microcystin-dependent protein
MEPFIGEITMFAGRFVPAGWAACDGRQVAIADYPTLYSLIGITYGGDGVTYFNLPDLRGRIPVHRGTLGSDTYTLGASGGAETVTLTASNLPPHSHPLGASSSAGTQASPSQGFLAQGQSYASVADPTYMASDTVGSAGLSSPFSVMQPYLTINYIIALSGVFPNF